MRKTNFVNESFYHIYNRGTEKRDIFLQNGDFIKFIRLLRKYKKNYVEIICYCLMPNHFHLLLQQKEKNGISEFMHRIGTTYTMFFNTKYKRNGVLFQGKFKSKEIRTDSQFVALSNYIHANPVKDLNIPIEQKIQKLARYLWSSYQDYVGLRNGSLINKKYLENFYQNDFIKKYKIEIISHIKYFENKNKIIANSLLE